MRVLLLKLSSMGDIIHTLPAITDATKLIPNLKFTWVVEEGFQEIAHWHPAIEKVIPISLRKKNYKQVWQAIKEIRKQNYDLVLDAQGLFKSCMFAICARGKYRVGFDFASAREHFPSFFYDKKCHASWDLHAVDRLRQLFAQTFSYQIPTNLDYGVAWEKIIKPSKPETPYLMFLHGTTWQSKHWPDEYWFSLADLVARQGYAVHVTWATHEQKARAQALAAQCKNVVMLPHLTLQQAADVIHHATGVVAVDTGFAHLTAALNKPMVAIYGATDVVQAGAKGNHNINLASKFACSPCKNRECNYKGAKTIEPPCLQEITPALVWQNLSGLIANTR